MEIKMLTKLVSEIDNLYSLGFYDKETGYSAGTITKGDKEEKFIIRATFIKEKNTHSHLTVKIPLMKKVETVVELGEHQGFNDKNEPIVIHYIWKEMFEFVSEVFAYSRALKRRELISKSENVERSALFNRIDALEETSLIDVERIKTEELNSLNTGEELLPENFLIESSSEEV